MRRALTIIGAAAALTGCGGTKPAPPAQRALPEATVQLADCNQWHELRGASRAQLVAGMRGFFGGKVDGAGHGYGETLDDTQAQRLLDNACKPSWAGRFKLYKIYGRAAAFTPSH